MKCDNKECNKKAIMKVRDPRLDLIVNVCEDHLKDLDRYIVK